MNETLIDDGVRIHIFQDIADGKGLFEEVSGKYRFKKLAKGITCNDGTTLSVQASKTHYCIPRDDYGPYSLVEVGFPSVEPPETWAEFFDGDWDTDDRASSVYGYVPINLVEEFIDAHGGQKRGKYEVKG